MIMFVPLCHFIELKSMQLYQIFFWRLHHNVACVPELLASSHALQVVVVVAVVAACLRVGVAEWA